MEKGRRDERAPNDLPVRKDEVTPRRIPRADSPSTLSERTDGAAKAPVEHTVEIAPPVTDVNHTLLYEPAQAKDDEAPIASPRLLDQSLAGGNSDQTRGGGWSDSLSSPRMRDRAAANEPVLEGVAVPGYEILRELGRGGMGVVYKARDLRLQRLVALKMILAGAHAGSSGLARFRAEAESVAQLHHPNIVQIFETGEHEGLPYFALEYLQEGSLEQRVKESPLTPRAAAELLVTLARAMEVAHQHGIIHRDLKPANILLGKAQGPSSLVRKSSMIKKASGFRRDNSTAAALASNHWFPNTVPKIADFGLAKRLDDASGQTHSGTILGTPSYMSPEQAEGKIREICPATDVYALGAILYELLTGRPPFKANSPIDTIRQLLDQEPVPPRQLEPGVPPDLETICLKCLEKPPARRYGSGGDLADDLCRFLDDEPILARPTSAWERAWKWGKNRPALVALMGVCAAACVGLGLLIVWHNVSLQGELIKARAEERLAREREQEALEGQRLSRLQAEGQKLFHDAQVAAAARDWANARLHLTQAIATIGDESGLEGLKDPAQALLKQVERELSVEAEGRASQTRFQLFAQLRDEAQFLGSLYTGMDLAANLKATRATVHQALAVYAVAAVASAPAPGGVPTLAEVGLPAFDPYLNDTQKGEILADYYQLLLILAETEAQCAPEQKTPERERQLREAVRLLREALRFGAPSRAYHLRRARYLSLLGDEDGSRKEELAAVDAGASHVLDHFLVGDEFYRRANFDEAVKSFNQVLQKKPTHFWAQYLSALSLLRLQRAAEARAQLSACLTQRPDFVWLYLLRGFAQGELQAFDEAEADYQKALQMPSNDFARYVLFVNRGVLRVRQARFDDAIADLNSAIALKPKEYQAYVNLARAYREKKDLDLALEQLNRAVELEPALAQLFRLRARLRLERKETALALRDFEGAIQRDTGDSPLLADDHVERGRLLLGDQKHSEALAAFDAALHLRKDHLPALRSQAEALFLLGRYQDAIGAFDRCLESGKPLESTYRGRGLARAEMGNHAGAIEDYTRALDLQPTAAVQTYRGWAHLVCGAPKLALRDFELAIQLDPKSADAFSGRGFILTTQGRYRDALQAAETALRLGPRTSRLLYNAGRIYAQCPGTNEARALDLIQQAVNLLPANQRVAFWSKTIRPDAALQSLRRSARYQKMDAELSARK